MKLFLMLVGLVALVAATGCVETVGGGKTAGVPLIRDTFTGRYQRPLETVFQASKEVVKDMGVLATESTLYDQTNSVKTVQGKVNQCSIWVRVEAVDPQITEVSVQARTKGGGSDMDLAHEIEKQIGIKLATR